MVHDTVNMTFVCDSCFRFYLRNFYVDIHLGNAALDKPSWQSSTDYNWTANRANDGNRNNSHDMHLNSCSHTEAPKMENNNRGHKIAWWQVDLEKRVTVKKVVLTTRYWGKGMSLLSVTTG